MSQIEFSLFAPTIDGAQIVASFTDGKPVEMPRDQDGHFRISFDLADGEYTYQFNVRTKSWFYNAGEWKTIIDPRATQVNEQENHGIVRIRNGQRLQDQYQWRHDAVPLPANNQLVVYELHVGDFSGGEADPHARGRFEHVVEKLDYLAELGVNAIELLPIKEYPGNHSWGYTPLHFFAVESTYGSTEDLKRLVDECHARGMRVIFDGVYNHAHTDTPLAQIDHDYWFHHEPKDKNNSWGPQFNYELWDEKNQIHPARQFVGDHIRHWIREYHIDGIRFDAARQIDNFDALTHMKASAYAEAHNKPFICIAEYLPEDPAVAGPDKPMDACWHDQFFWTVSDNVLTGKSIDLEKLKDVIDPSRAGFTDCTQVVNYVSNHDHDRLMKRLAEHQIFHEHAFARAHLAATINLTAVGIPMIWMGGEFGEYKPKTQEIAKIDWTLLKNEPNRNLFNHYRRLIELRKSNPALQCNAIQFFFEDTPNQILAYVRWTEAGKRVVIVLNLQDVPRPGYAITHFPEDGEWHEWIADRKVQVNHRTLTTDLGGLEGKIFVWH